MMPEAPLSAAICSTVESKKEQPIDSVEHQITHACQQASKCVSNCSQNGEVCPYDAQAAGRRARRRQESIMQSSVFFAGGVPPMRPIDQSELLIGDQLGEGGWACVKACSFKNAPLKEPCAIKHLRRDMMLDYKSFLHGACDLRSEALYLSRLDHPNIIRLHGISSGDLESCFSSGKETGFFLVIDRLTETLKDRIVRWRVQTAEVPTNLLYRLSKECKDTHRAMLKERLEVALKIANVLQYLHEMNILYRDLKSDNVGFDESGETKVFDFGFAKEAKAVAEVADGTYKMSGNTGSNYYMAPEVARDKPYNKSVDVYSFGILLWEMCAMEKLENKSVWSEGRPKMDTSYTAQWPVQLQRLMMSCWSTDPSLRPTSKVVRETLEGALEDLPPKARIRSRPCLDGTTSDKTGHDRGTSLPLKKPSKRFGTRLLRLRS